MLLQTKPDLIVDFGSVRDTYVSLAERVQAQTGIPYILIDGRFENTAASVRLLGAMLGVEERAERIASYVESTLAKIDATLAEVPQEERPRVYLARGPDGLETGLQGSINTEIIERVGAINVAVDPSGARRGIAQVPVEQVMVWNPDVVITWDGNFYETVCAGLLLAGRGRGGGGPGVSEPDGAVRLDRPAALAQSPDRAAVAGGAVLPGAHQAGFA